MDFATAPELVAEVHRGDGRAALATLAATWADPATDLIAVAFPGTASAGLAPGNYLLSVRLASEAAHLSYNPLVVYPGTAATSPVRSLIAPSQCLGVIPEMQGDLGQVDALPWLLEAATVACERYCDMALVVTDFDYLTGHDRRGEINLRGRPVYDFRIRANPGTGTGISDYTEALTDYLLAAEFGSVEFEGHTGGFLTDYGQTTVGRRHRRLVRLTYRAGYAIDPIDVVLGIEPVPKDLQSACLMVAIANRESAKTAGPTTQQGLSGMYYTKSATETAIPAPARALLDRYSRAWGVA